MDILAPGPVFFFFFFYFYFLDFIYLSLERREGREKERERNSNMRQIHGLVAPCLPPARDLPCNPGTCPAWESIRRPFGSLILCSFDIKAIPMFTGGQRGHRRGLTALTWPFRGPAHGSWLCRCWLWGASRRSGVGAETPKRRARGPRMLAGETQAICGANPWQVVEPRATPRSECV